MKLYEFFGSMTHDVNEKAEKDPNKMNKEDEEQLADDVFWFIVDDDDLHKKYFMPIARELKKTLGDDSYTHDYKVWKPMTTAGCIKYYEENDVPGNPKETFNKKFRIDLCKRLSDHFHKDIVKGEYDLGQ